MIPSGRLVIVPATPLVARRRRRSTPRPAYRRDPWSSRINEPDEPRKPKRPKGPKRPKRPKGPPPSAADRSVHLPVTASAEALLRSINPDAAGIDVHSDMHMVCVPADRDAEPVRQFGANTADLQAIAAWLKACGITTVAMESTGVYWIPLFELLESEGFEVKLVEPGQLSRCGARPKTDVLDAQWIQRLHSYGLLRGSFRPPDAVLALRAYWRQRQMLMRYAAGHVQHMQKALEQMNVKLTEVVSSIIGVTGMAIITAILAGERDPAKLAQLRDRAVPPRARTRSPWRWRGRGGPSTSSRCGRRTTCTSSTTARSTSATARSQAELDRLPDRSRGARPRRRRRGDAGGSATTCGSRPRARCSRRWAWT